MATASDSKHQSALDWHGHKVEHSTQRVSGGVEHITQRVPGRVELEQRRLRRALAPAAEAERETAAGGRGEAGAAVVVV